MQHAIWQMKFVWQIECGKIKCNLMQYDNEMWQMYIRKCNMKNWLLQIYGNKCNMANAICLTNSMWQNSMWLNAIWQWNVTNVP